MRTEAATKPNTIPTAESVESRQGPSVPHLIALASSAVMAGAFAPDAISDGITYLNAVIDATPPTGRAYLPHDFQAKAILGTVGTFNTLWFMFFAIKAGREPREGAPLNAPQVSADS